MDCLIKVHGSDFKGGSEDVYDDMLTLFELTQTTAAQRREALLRSVGKFDIADLMEK